jgi:hypothetical protein
LVLDSSTLHVFGESFAIPIFLSIGTVVGHLSWTCRRTNWGRPGGRELFYKTYDETVGFGDIFDRDLHA